MGEFRGLVKAMGLRRGLITEDTKWTNEVTPAMSKGRDFGAQCVGIDGPTGLCGRGLEA